MIEIELSEAAKRAARLLELPESELKDVVRFRRRAELRAVIRVIRMLIDTRIAGRDLRLDCEYPVEGRWDLIRVVEVQERRGEGGEGS